MRFGPSQLSYLGSSVGRALCLEYRVSWVRVSPEAAHFFLGKVTALGVLCCFALFVCLTLLASLFLPSHLSFKNMYICRLCMYTLINTPLPSQTPNNTHIDIAVYQQFLVSGEGERCVCKCVYI